MRRPSRPALLPTLLLGLALPLALTATAGEIYQWKDAKGVTHYSDSPPPGQKATTRSITGAPSPAPPAESRPVANADCTNARSNLALLQSKEKVGVDDDKDGKPDRELTAAERASRLKLAEAQIETYCDRPAADAVTTRR